MSATGYVRDALEVTIDRQAAILAAVFMAVLVPSVYLAVFDPVNIQRPDYGLEGAALGGAWAIAEVVVAIVLVALIILARRLPEWVKRWMLHTAIVWLAMILGGAAYIGDEFLNIMGIFAVGYFGIVAVTEYDLWWIFNNLMVLAIAIWLAPLGAVIFGVEALVVAMVGLSIYDWYFADRNKWMFAMGEVMMRFYAPVIFIIPSKLRVDWEGLIDSEADDELPEGVEEAEPELTPEERADEVGVSMGIGTADLLLPAMFAAAVATAPTPLAINGVPAAVLGVTAGTVLACFRLRWKILERDGGAGLPPLATGALAGYAPFWLATTAVTVL